MEPMVTTQERIEHRAGYQTTTPPRRPAWAGVDQDWSRRPGRLHVENPTPFPNTRFPPERQQGEPTSPTHGRPNKTLPPVFGTAVPLKGVSGAVRRFAYSYADHYPAHWLLMLLGDRIEVWSHRLGKAAPVLLPLTLALGVGGRRLLGR